MKINIILLLAIILNLSCNQTGNSSIKVIDNNNIKSIFNKEVNLVFIWTTWCGVSKSILINLYKNLKVDSSKVNVILLCGNADIETVDSIFKKEKINCTNYFINNNSNLFAFIDRKNIKNFIESNFKNINGIDLKGNYGIPISLLIDSNLNVIDNNVPQKSDEIINLLNNYIK